MSANTSTTTATRAREQGPDMAESAARSIDKTVKGGTGLSVFHWLTIGAIGASVALFLSGKKDLAIFIGLWPPTFQALKAASENKQNSEV